MNFFGKKSVIATHDGRFHADDIFACATLSILLDGKIKIVRTRDPKIIDSADYVVDVGGIHDPGIKRFDHHQKGGAGVRESGVPYASFGLVWKEYGERVCGSKEVADVVERRLVESIDAGDNAYATFTTIKDRPFPYLINSFMNSFMPTWKESSELSNKSFLRLVSIMKDALLREITHASDRILARMHVRTAYESADDKRIVVLEKMYPWEDLLLEYSEPLFVVASRGSNKWKAEGTLVESGSFDRRAYFPEAWSGLRDSELERVSGVPGALFCHNGRFLCAATSKESAIALAQKALEATS